MVRRILIGLLTLVAVVAGGGYLYLQSSLQPVDGKVSLQGISGKIMVLRDKNGIPHIDAPNMRDALFALGYVHVQDRLWQMEMNRRIGAGRLSEIFGAKALGTDKFLRALDVYGHAERAFERFTPKTQERYRAYVEGINAALKNWSGALPPEFIILGFEPESWRVADSLVWIKMMAWDLGDNWDEEIFRLQLLKKLSPEQVAEIMPPYPGDEVVDLPKYDTLFADLELNLGKLMAIAPPPLPEGAGSNNWVVSGDRSETGKPLLANDPHLGLAAPALWYYAHIKTPQTDAIGATLPGVPGIILGRNQHIAWGFTNTAPDTQDMFIEKAAPEKPGYYVTPEGIAPFKNRAVQIKVKGGETEKLTVRSTRHGPIISDLMRSAKEALLEKHSLAFSWVALRDDDLSAQAAVNLMEATNWEEFKDVLKDFHTPQQNVVFADTKGNIGYIAPGRVPIRKPENKIKGVMPVPGWDATFDWDGFIPFDELPQTYNPANGQIFTANQKIITDDYPHFITYDWTLPYRAHRIDHLLGQKPKHSVTSFMEIQADVKSLMAEELLPLMIKALPQADQEREIVKKLAGWNYHMAMNKPEPLLFAGWFREMTQNIYGDELGALLGKNWEYRPNFMAKVLSGVNGQDRWCDDLKTSIPEDCTLQVSSALKSALTDLEKRFGPAKKWRWGEAHFAHNDHRPFSKITGLKELFDIKVPSAGGTYTVNVGRHDFAEEHQPFANEHAASLRAIYDLANLNKSQFIFSTGQSGNVLSTLYDNMATKWSRHGYIPLTTNPDDYEKDALGKLILQPQRPIN